MQCQEAQARLSAYLDCELDAGSNDDLTSHLNGCSHCQGVLNRLETVDSRLRRLPRVELDPEFSSRLVALISEPQLSGGYELRETHPTGARPSGLLDSLRDLFGLKRQAGADPLEEFGDFPPLTIGSAYFSIFGQPGD